MVVFSMVATHADLNLETVALLSNGAATVASSASHSATVSGTVVLATCNRFEIYAEAPAPEDLEAARSAVVAEISQRSGLPERTVSDAFRTHEGADVARHLFAVSSGLDSAVVGEREIAGQVRRALISAQEDGTASPPLVRLFQAASRTAKDVATQTALGSRGLSIVSVALDLAADLADDPDWSSKRAVLFGTGAYAGATMALLRERGCLSVDVYSSSGRAEEFAAARGGVALSGEQLPEAIADADILIGCSGSTTPMEAVELAAIRSESPRQLIVIDLALTHDFDPAVGSLDGIELVTLESVRLAAPQEQAEALIEASRIVGAAAADFEAQRQARQADAAIVALRRHTMAVLDSEIEKVRARHGCTAAAEEVEFAMRRMVKQLLHTPTVRARELAAQGREAEYLAALDALYGISIDLPSVVADALGDEASGDEAPSEVGAAEDCPVDHSRAG
ncbi:glutamyl-tRNA reductase [Sinomonas sp. ASV322]|uniref:glutamyl-tRNA reductase n=1 Tax=Sinomonas sp. ASV322 TaxID=3041920 RepID=UPI0027DC32F3|nr:glutamyl-tRNA reductase [Sinomonas sp. ASV322]MDQ4503325.1 glutamyl-tRNA reductase [Sinomonas sp. ASV322]